MNPDKLKKLQAQVRIGGKGTPRRKKKVVHQAAGADDKKLQGVLKKINISPIAGIEEANMIKNDGTVIHFNNPKVQASLSANTFAITGHGETKRAQDFLPGILSQLGTSDFRSWGQLATELAAKTKLAAAEDDDVPDLVENFEEVAKKDELESITKKTEEITVA